MHATSPTKPESPLEPVVCTGLAISTSSIPIATSTPVNAPVGPIHLPPLSQELLGKTSYPAVLKGKSNASPPNPNLVPSGKVPPPVPPRGSISGKGRADDHRASTTTTMTSGRGDTVTTFLHESAITRRPLESSIPLHVTVPCARPPIRPSRNLSQESNRSATPFPTANKARSGFRNGGHRSAVPNHRNVNYLHFNEESDIDKEEFVRVEKINDSYFIQTSPHPFRPERGVFKRDVTYSSSLKMNTIVRKSEYTPSINMPKFTYFINPASNSELINYKMSRKDKKHSETYSEKMKRLENEQNEKKQTSAPVSANSNSSRIVHTSTKIVYHQESRTWLNDAATKIKMGQEPVNRLFRKIQETRGPKRMAPIPPPRKRSARDLDSTTNEWRDVNFYNSINIQPSKICNVGLKKNHCLSRSRKIFRTLEAPSPNIWRSSEILADTQKVHLNDEEYRIYLDDKSKRATAALPNRSFLHGYANARRFK